MSLFYNPDTYNHKESLLCCGGCLLSWVEPTEKDAFRNAIERLQELLSKEEDGTPSDLLLVEDRWTRLVALLWDHHHELHLVLQIKR